ncbi:uncharacterized protein LOC127850545 [Dreissena polymorpha]|uniref:Uncharacterized protein n=1 Tax=Dreissena polymorpha TaxID=45954 RepID=A0A9D4HUQ6_DREPO|nr:uncharacterized protein LOC127835195 [Dreissena polymorpha]XP_052239629.1 uncharacterized protein LOC127850545 [Dreissena polymorpha]KAH3733494.1 hypothetical protein DPMN_039922 [Dreissena polymorpha]KAH3809830.1 hypothetical protein DPMN_138210 [Dreissena polymorpha]
MMTRRSGLQLKRETRSSNVKTEIELKTELKQSEIRFRKACNQINLLNKKMESIHKRYNCAKKKNHRVFRYKLRLRLAVVEGLRNMYYEYANKKASRVVELRSELFNENVEIVQQEDSEFEDSEMEDSNE